MTYIPLKNDQPISILFQTPSSIRAHPLCSFKILIILLKIAQYMKNYSSN